MGLSFWILIPSGETLIRAYPSNKIDIKKVRLHYTSLVISCLYITCTAGLGDRPPAPGYSIDSNSGQGILDTERTQCLIPGDPDESGWY